MNMITSKSATEIGKLFRFFHAITLSPYEWNEKTKNLQLTKSRLRLGLWRFHIALFAISAVYRSSTFVARILNSSFNSTTDLILHCIFMAAEDSFFLACLNCSIYAEELGQFVNQLLKMDNSLTGECSFEENQELNILLMDFLRNSVQYNGAQSDGKERDRLERMLPMVIPWAMGNIGPVIATYVRNPDNPRFLGFGLIPLGWPGYTTGFLLELLSQLQVYHMVVTYWILFFAVFSSVTNHWLRVITR